MKRFVPLVEGDIVDIVAPASRCSEEDVQRGIAAVRALGLVPRVPKDLFTRSILFSGKDETRLRHLRDALYARDSKLIWCVRGGYGSLRLLPEMRRWRKPAHPKVLLGYSDITSVHAFLNQEWGWPSWHGPMVERFGRGTMPARDSKELVGLLFGKISEVSFSRLRPLNSAARRSGAVRGRVVGGNMAVLQSSLGTPSALKPGRGQILFFEDIGERPHRMDRMFTQFAQAGWFERVGAVVLGSFQLEGDVDRRQLWSDVIPRFAASVRVPVVAGLPVGHDPVRQRVLPFNTPARLDLGRGGRLTVSV